MDRTFMPLMSACSSWQFLEHIPPHELHGLVSDVGEPGMCGFQVVELGHVFERAGQEAIDVSLSHSGGANELAPG